MPVETRVPAASVRRAVTPKAIKVGGFTPFTATDYPGKLAAVVFVQGCPWRCGYCHNPHLQERTATSPMEWADVVARLKRRVGLIDAVVFSGGEPTMDPGLEDAMRDVRTLGFAVGLHTAGMYPQRLAALLPLVDWVGMDIKATPGGYDSVTGMAASSAPAFASAEVVIAQGVAHEFRTTVHPELHAPADILALATQLSTMGVRNYALQVFRATGCPDTALGSATLQDYPGNDTVAATAARFARFTLRA